MSNVSSYLILGCAVILMFVVAPWSIFRSLRNKGQSVSEFSLSRDSAALQEALPVPATGTKIKRVNPRKRRGDQATLTDIAAVEFDPLDMEHLVALSMLMQEPQKLHPTLRFSFNPAEFDNAYSACLSKFAKSRIPAAAHHRASELALKKRKKKRPAPATEGAKVSALVKPTKVVDRVKYETAPKQA